MTSWHHPYLYLAAWCIGTVLAVYVLAAYVVAPALWRRYEHRPGLAALPMVTLTAQRIPGDPLNVGLAGSRTEVVRALTQANWHPADPITLRTSVEIGVAVILRRAYADAPVSSLIYQGRRQDLAFEMPVGHSPARRHHVRLWQVLPADQAKPELWMGSATYDHGVGVSHDTGQITHHIDGDLDAERTFFIGTLTTAGSLARIGRMPGIGATLRGRNGGGDLYFTDGDVYVGVLIAHPDEAAQTPAPERPASPPAGPLDRIWVAPVATGRWLRLLPQPRAN